MGQHFARFVQQVASELPPYTGIDLQRIVQDSIGPMNLSHIRRLFADDTEFLKLCDRHEQVDLSLTALELARDYFPDLDFDFTLQWIDERADEIRQDLFKLKSPFSQVEMLMDLLGNQHGLHGHTTAYHEAGGSYLNAVVETGRGIPISLSVAYMAVANRAGIDLQGVAAPAHFMTRLETIEGPVFLDAYTPGRFLLYDECVDWIQVVADVSRRDARSGLKPVGPRAIVIRMLNNLKVLYVEQQQWQHALRVQNRLLLLNPSQYAARRDLALISLKAGRPGEALALLQKLVHTAPEAERDSLRRQINLAFSEVSRWN